MSETICRLCLAESGDFQTVFTVIELPESEQALNLIDIISEFTRIKIEPGDGLPDQICHTCTQDTINTYFFKLRCEENDAILRKKLEATTKEKQIDLSDELENLPSPEVKSKAKSFDCHICPKTFSREDLLLRHKIAHVLRLQKEAEEKNINNGTIGETPLERIEIECFTDTVCKEGGDLEDKEEPSQNKGINYPCPFCFMVYSKKGNLDKHLSVHTSDTEADDQDKAKYSCDHCSLTFRSKKDVRRHLRKFGLFSKKECPSKKVHLCEFCFKSFNQISNLKDHLRTHSGEKPFLCPTCGKGFNQLGNLHQHQVRHSGVKSHVCTTCGHGFASKGELSAHLRKHTGARPFVCDICGKGFTASSSLTKHKRIHSGEKPYQCEYCNMKFSRSGILSRHRRIHTGEKPYVCKICEKAFTQSNDLNSHTRIHTGEKPYKCDECGQMFRQNSALRTHKKTHLVPKQHRQSLKKVDVFVEDEENIIGKFSFMAGTV